MELALTEGFDILETNKFESLDERELYDYVGGDTLSTVCEFVVGGIAADATAKGIAYLGTKVAWVAAATTGPVGALAVLLVSGAVGSVAAELLIRD